jgi:hypothetical protein
MLLTPSAFEVQPMSHRLACSFDMPYMENKRSAGEVKQVVPDVASMDDMVSKKNEDRKQDVIWTATPKRTVEFRPWEVSTGVVGHSRKHDPITLKSRGQLTPKRTLDAIPSVSGSVSTPEKVSKAVPLKSLKFDGSDKGDDWVSFLGKFEMYADMHNLGEEEKRAHLCWAMTGSAARFCLGRVRRDKGITYK